MKAIIGIGVPGSGKTTVLKPLADASGLVYINADDIRQEINGDAANHSRHLYIMKLFNDRAVKALESGVGVVLDGTYSKKRDRLAAIDLCRRAGAKEVTGYWFDVPTTVAVERNSKRSRVVPDAAIYTMCHRLRENPPSTSEGFDQLVIIKE